MIEFVTIKTFDSAPEAHIYKNRLEGDGIEFIVSVNPLYSNAVGGIKLKVIKDDLNQALEILRSIEDQPFTDNEGNLISCSKCGSTSLKSDYTSMKDAKGLVAAIISFLFYVFPLHFKRIYKCNDCGYEFDRKKI
jgi:DNA-directed RNA polymerase subunit RPC12/RpoP